MLFKNSIYESVKIIHSFAMRLSLLIVELLLWRVFQLTYNVSKQPFFLFFLLLKISYSKSYFLGCDRVQNDECSL